MKIETRSLKPKTNMKPETSNQKRFDLEDRTFLFARDVRNLVTKLPKTIASIEDTRQLIRSSGSVGANYLEANESLSKKDFLMRIKIAKKEARESIYWLELLQIPSSSKTQHQQLLKEASEIMNILGAILRNAS